MEPKTAYGGDKMNIWDAKSLFVTEWSVESYDEYVLICDGASRWWTTLADIEDATLPPEDSTDSERYNFFCGSAMALRDEDIPAHVLCSARYDLGIKDDNPVSRGW